MDREGANKQFANAKRAKNDEFYTLYEDIQKEINAYLEYNPDTFRNKTVCYRAMIQNGVILQGSLHRILKLLD